jgi:hypothetical protein
VINGRFYDEPGSATLDDMRAEAENNIASIKPGDSYMAADVLVLSQWIISLLPDDS